VSTLLRHARVLTLCEGGSSLRAGPAQAELSPIDDAAVLLDESGIAWVGRDGDLPPNTKATTEEDLEGRVVMPALVDSHTHVVWGGHRRDELELRLAGADYEEIFAAGGGILSSVDQTRDASDDALLEQSTARVRRMLATGTTTVEIKSGYGLDLPTELKQLRVARSIGETLPIRVRTTCLAAHAIPAEFRAGEGARETFVASVCDTILPAVAAAGLADYADVFCDRGAFTPEEATRILVKARSLGLELRVHANEFGHTGGAAVAAELGARSADHLLYLDADERSALREAGVAATLLPGTSMVLGKPFADGRAMVDDGVPVCVATDCNPGSCAFENLALVLALACYGNRLSPAEAIVAATHNPAASLGLADQVGRVVPGLAGDLLVLDTSDERDLVYHAGSPLIHQVYYSGAPIH
jgi:imidazolonepropionase